MVKNNMLCEIIPVSPFKEDPRGNAYGVEAAASQTIVIHRNKGSISGNHYHTGKTPSKSPETFFIISGTLQVDLRQVKTGQTESHTVGENHMIRIPAMVHHKILAVTNAVFLEFNQNKDDFREDTVYSEK